jgi:hypothetical protein
LDLVGSSHPRWAYIWQILWKESGAGSTAKKDSLAVRGRKWLEAQANGVDWPLVWMALWSTPDLRDETMRTIAQSRLSAVSPADRQAIEAQLLAVPEA